MNRWKSSFAGSILADTDNLAPGAGPTQGTTRGNRRQGRAGWKLAGKRVVLLGVFLGLVLGFPTLLVAEACMDSPDDKKGASDARNVPVTIIKVNVKKGVVLVRDTAGITFEFPAEARTLKSLKIGQKLDTKFIRAVSHQAQAATAATPGGRGLPFCPCGKMGDGKCWCSKCLGDPCFKIGCPYGDCRAFKVGEDDLTPQLQSGVAPSTPQARPPDAPLRQQPVGPAAQQRARKQPGEAEHGKVCQVQDQVPRPAEGSPATARAQRSPERQVHPGENHHDSPRESAPLSGRGSTVGR